MHSKNITKVLLSFSIIFFLHLILGTLVLSLFREEDSIRLIKKKVQSFQIYLKQNRIIKTIKSVDRPLDKINDKTNEKTVKKTLKNLIEKPTKESIKQIVESRSKPRVEKIKSTPKPQIKKTIIKSAQKPALQKSIYKIIKPTVSTAVKGRPIYKLPKINTKQSQQKLRQARVDYHRRLSAYLKDKLVYPRFAQKMRMSGDALVSIDIFQGVFKKVRLYKSSGHEVLDQAAINLVRSASGKIPSTSSLFEKPFKINVNIRYHK